MSDNLLALSQQARYRISIKVQETALIITIQWIRKVYINSYFGLANIRQDLKRENTNVDCNLHRVSGATQQIFVKID